MSMTKRIFALLLTVAMLVCALAACNKEPEVTTPEATTPESTTPEPEFPTTPPKKITAFSVVSGSDATESLMASEIKWYLTQKGLTLSESGYQISVVLDDTVVADGYKIVATENALTVAGGNERGLVCGVYAFLEKYAGVHLYATDTVVVDDTDVMIGGGILESFEPTFEVLRNPWFAIDKLPEKDGGSIEAANKTAQIKLNVIAGTGSLTTCLSDAAVLERAIANVKGQLSTDSTLNTVRFSPATDYDKYCTCEECAAVHTEEGSPAGNYIRFLNKVYEAVAAEYPEVKFEIVPRAYLTEAPKVTKPAEGISILFDMEKCHLSHPITDTACEDAVSFAATLKSWSEFCDSVHVEYRISPTEEYMPVFADLGALYENIRFFAECGVSSINFTGNIAYPSSNFGELRYYLINRLLQDPTMTVDEYYAYMDEFLAAFYGEGWTYVRKFIDKIIELSADGHQTVKDSPFLAITEEEYISHLQLFEEWWNKAEELAGDDLAHVKRSRFQWRYVKLCLLPDKEDALAMIAENAASFNYRIAWREARWNVDTTNTNFALAPTEWVYKS